MLKFKMKDKKSTHVGRIFNWFRKDNIDAYINLLNHFVQTHTHSRRHCAHSVCIAHRNDLK